MKTWQRVAIAVVSSVSAAFLLAGCSSSGGSSTTAAPAAPAAPVATSTSGTIFYGTVANSHITTKHGPGDVLAGATVVLVKASDVEDSGSIQPVEDLANDATKGYPTEVSGADGTFTFTAADFTGTNLTSDSYYTFVKPKGYNPDPTKDTSDYWPGSCASRQALTYSGTKVDIGVAADDCDDAANQVQVTYKNSPTSQPKATYIGSTTCLVCHPKNDLKHTLHFVGFRVPGVWNSALQDKTGLQAIYKNKTFDGGLALFTNSGTCIAVYDGSGNDPTDAANYKFALLSKDTTTTPVTYSFQMAANATKIGPGTLTFTTAPNTVTTATYCATALLSDSYKIAFTYGGEGLYKQRYMAMVGATGNGTTASGTYVKHVQDGGTAYYYAFPFQWNESGSVAPEFDKDGESWGQWTLATVTKDAAIFTGDKTYTTSADVKATTEEQFATDCSGCHGATSITKNKNGDYITSYIDQLDGVYAGNIGCEKCHGPGSTHQANGGDGYYITYPMDLPSGRLTMLCGTCHQRKQDPASSGKLDAAGDMAKFPAVGDLTTTDGVINTFRPGMSPAQMYANGTNGAGLSPNFGNTATGAYFYAINYTTDGHSWQDKQYGSQVNHSKGHHQQYFDLTKAGMWKNDKELITCIDCHDAHGTDLEFQLVNAPDNNALCLDCHNGDEQTIGGFGSITRAMVDALQADGTTDPGIATAVEGHMKDKAGMTATYDPTGTGVGRCTLCHMPQTAKSARWSPVGSRGYRTGDIHSHTFDVMNPIATQKMFTAKGSKTAVTPSGWTNSCGVCHPNNTL